MDPGQGPAVRLGEENSSFGWNSGLRGNALGLSRFPALTVEISQFLKVLSQLRSDCQCLLHFEVGFPIIKA